MEHRISPRALRSRGFVTFAVSTQGIAINSAPRGRADLTENQTPPGGRSRRRYRRAAYGLANSLGRSTKCHSRISISAVLCSERRSNLLRTPPHHPNHDSSPHSSGTVTVLACQRAILKTGVLGGHHPSYGLSASDDFPSRGGHGHHVDRRTAVQERHFHDPQLPASRPGCDRRHARARTELVFLGLADVAMRLEPKRRVARRVAW